MCPFVSLPEKDDGRWGQGFASEKKKRRELEPIRGSNRAR
jgi:hypothetical protein